MLKRVIKVILLIDKTIREESQQSGAAAPDRIRERDRERFSPKCNCGQEKQQTKISIQIAILFLHILTTIKWKDSFSKTISRTSTSWTRSGSVGVDECVDVKHESP